MHCCFHALWAGNVQQVFGTGIKCSIDDVFFTESSTQTLDYTNAPLTGLSLVFVPTFPNNILLFISKTNHSLVCLECYAAAALVQI